MPNPTRDIDVLARAVTNDPDTIRASITTIAAVTTDDGVTFDTDAIHTRTIREDAGYWGIRATLPAMIARARLKLSLDINFGDPVTPAPQPIELPQLLQPGTFTMLGYPIETVIAEKLATAIAIGDANTRDRDYADLYRIITQNDLTGSTLTEAIRQTGAYRGTQLQPLSSSIHTLADPLLNDEVTSSRWDPRRRTWITPS